MNAFEVNLEKLLLGQMRVNGIDIKVWESHNLEYVKGEKQIWVGDGVGGESEEHVECEVGDFGIGGASFLRFSPTLHYYYALFIYYIDIFINIRKAIYSILFSYNCNLSHEALQRGPPALHHHLEGSLWQFFCP